MSLNRKAGSRVVVAAAIAVLALSASACGGGKKSSSASATEAWAGGVCSAFTTWRRSYEDILSSIHHAELDQAASQLEDANNALGKSLKKLGPPNTASGTAAKDDISGLKDSLSTSMSTIKAAVSGNPTGADFVSAYRTVNTEVQKMVGSLSTTVTELKSADVGAEIEQAFKQAPSCASY